jgi:hypothetical protein
VLFGSVNANRHHYELAAAAVRPEDIKTVLACRDGAPQRADAASRVTRNG